MIKRIQNKLTDTFLSKWIVLIFDIAIVFVTIILANLIRHNFDMQRIDIPVIKSQSILVMIVYVLSFLLTGSYSGIIRHTGLKDVLNIFKSTFLAFVALLIIYVLFYEREHTNYYIPGLSIFIIQFLLILVFLIGSRFMIKSFFSEILSKSKKEIRVLIYGSGGTGMHTYNALINDSNYRYYIIAFIDDNKNKIQKTYEGIPIVSAENALTEKFVNRNKVELLIIAIQNLEVNSKKRIIEGGLNAGLKVKVAPSVNSWINGQFRSTQIEEVHLEELLGRDPISLDNKMVAENIVGKVILVTGAAGSIGSELVRQILQYKPEKVILVDQAESPLFDLQFEINSYNPLKEHALRAIYVIANVKDLFRMEQIFNKYRPELVFHAAAYKHVPLMEENPYEAILVNIFGTKTIADLSLKYQVKKFVMISTDKAVNPTNVMGATKRVAEIYIQCMSNETTQFITTRFGNVLGSNGSVIPIFKKQIEKGGPVTVTHKDITRYFMTIPEACNLVLDASAMGHGREIFVFDMGTAVNIYDLAWKMIQLSGLIPGKDIHIIETGLRPGEKLYEELLAHQENIMQTHHPKILIADVRQYEIEEISSFMEELSQIMVENDTFALVKKMKQLVPEYISNNSVFSCLD